MSRLKTSFLKPAILKNNNKLFIEFGKNILKDRINFDNLSQREQEKMVEINKFFCELHYFVGLGDQAKMFKNIGKDFLNWDKMKHKNIKGCRISP